MKQYQLLFEKKLDQIEKKVNFLSKSGWVLVGPVQFLVATPTEPFAFLATMAIEATDEGPRNKIRAVIGH